ncbi:hypothetical protein [Duganella radicis]|uniref:Uncharacterized protein n=1 Tax=Duganella radicis TaxID=551988 RepID=A0A6L6PCP0_9BURK|nr:hypothetical protein [Duganella radicis]MTV36287.1 hypothetical protein [Duganella radicis]
MRYPNLRYGSPSELAYYITTDHGTVRDVARRLRRDERTVKDWASGKTRVPWWVPEIMRLQRMESDQQLRQMGIRPQRGLGVVTHEGQLELRRPAEKKTPQITDLRRDEFNPVDRVMLAALPSR